MTEKTPIKPADIKIGDTIRAEGYGGEEFGISLFATEFEVVAEQTDIGFDEKLDYFLLHRPEPEIEVPTEFTLGWLTTTETARKLDFWHRDEDCASNYSGSIRKVMKKVTEFTEAIAVPRDKVEALCVESKKANKAGSVADSKRILFLGVHQFLAGTPHGCDPVDISSGLG